MKRRTIINGTIVIYLIGLICVYWGVSKYIQNKDIRLRQEIHSKLEDVFERDKYIDIAYSGYKVGYEKVSIPKKPKFDLLKDDDYSKITERVQEEWKETYGDLYSLNRIKFKKSDREKPWLYEDGWNLVTIRHDYNGVYQTWLFPYAVGYIKQDYSWQYNYLPSIKDAVENALEFYTKNEQSNFLGDFQEGCHKEIWSKILDCQNEYYFIDEDSIPRFSTIGTPLFDSYESYNSSKSSYQAGYMYNGYYKVFIGETQPSTWTIRKMYWHPDEKEKKELWTYWGVGISVAFLLIIIPLTIMERKYQKIKNESLHDKLIRLCNPLNFMKEYDKEKIDIANSIYEQLLNIKQDDKEALMVLQERAVTELGLKLIDKAELEDLKEKVNPKRFLNPYNAEKVSLANELYSILGKENLTYSEFIEIKEKSKHL